MTTYRFDGPKVQAVKNLPCPVCGKKIRRQRTLQHTVNPYNRVPDGSRPKTWEEVRSDVQMEAAAWKDEPETHVACTDARVADYEHGGP